MSLVSGKEALSVLGQFSETTVCDTQWKDDTSQSQYHTVVRVRGWARCVGNGICPYSLRDGQLSLCEQTVGLQAKPSSPSETITLVCRFSKSQPISESVPSVGTVCFEPE